MALIYKINNEQEKITTRINKLSTTNIYKKYIFNMKILNNFIT
jgi:hypothetical protein